MKIVNIRSLQILDSRSNPTLQVDVYLEDGSKGTFQVPSGASTGIHEAHELRDGNKNIFKGKSVLKAIENINKIKDKLINKDFSQENLDQYLIELDGTENKENLGANSILGISIAFAKASATFYNIPLFDYIRKLSTNSKTFESKNINPPTEIHLFANIINGGLHSGNSLNIQEFMIVPLEGKFQEKVRQTSEIYNELKDIISEKYGKANTSVGDEGGFAPLISKAEEALDLIMEAIKNTHYDNQIGIAIDSAASDFYLKNENLYEVEEGLKLNYKELSQYYSKLVEKYPIVSIEDPFEEDDFEGFAYFMKNVPKTNILNPFNNKNEIIVVGDDLLVTNPKRIDIAINKKLCSSLLLKINQIGTLTESLKAYNMASEKNWHTIVSHRSGETTDDFISDLSVGISSSIKIGAPARGERIVKYNKLLNIYYSY